MTTSSTRYRMPVGFGPAPGPRQKADGTEWTAQQTETMRQEFLTVDFLGRAAQLQRLLPPGFRLRGEPVVSVQLGFFRDLYWLAGRGYGVLHPLIPVTYEGRTETIEGSYMPVIWEGLADAIVTGRDELGFPKLAADFPRLDVDLARGSVTGSASWLGFEFFSATLTGLTEVPDARPPASAPMITFKYVPRTGPHGAGGADIAHVTTGAAAANGGSADAGYRRWEGTGEIAWHRAKFEQLPTTFHVVNGLADLDVVEYRGAAYFQAALPGHVISGAGQRIVEPAEDLRHAAF
jgi:Acetoacetate decarboxylase (ADC)